MRRLSFVIPTTYDGRRVVHFLRGDAGCSAALVTALKKTPDGILLDGVHARTIDLLYTGALLTLTLYDEAREAPLVPSAREAEVLYEDEDVIVFDKPADMPSHPSKQHQQDTLANVFARLCEQRGVTFTWRVINRLDRNTTGAVVVAKNAFAAAALAGNVDKVYLAVTEGVPMPLTGTIDAPIGRPDERDIRREVLADGQAARTEYRVLKALDDGEARYSAVRCTLPTGRTHQIRVHLAHIGCPLVGDDLYGGSRELAARQMLHCVRVRFIHPVDRQEVTVVAPIPKDMQKFL